MDTEHDQVLSDAWVRVRDGPAVRAAITTGAGERSFTTSADLKSYIPSALEQLMSRHLQGTEDLQEGARPFAEKRRPRFQGR